MGDENAQHGSVGVPEGVADEPAVESDIGSEPAAKMTVKDKLALAISALALAVSAANFYITNLRSMERVDARLVDIVLVQDQSIPSTFVLQFAVVNVGNKPAILGHIGYALKDADANSPGRDGQVMTPEVKLPLLISPGEVKVVHVAIPILRDLVKFEEGSSMRWYLNFSFSMIDSHGDVHRSGSGDQLQIETQCTKGGTQCEWTPTRTPLTTAGFPLFKLLDE